MALKGKQAVFVEKYLACFNATQAAIQAGYSPKTAYSIGAENLKKPEISEAISKRLSESAMTADEVLMRLADHARSDIGEFLTLEGASIATDLAAMKQAKKTHLIRKITQTQRRRSSKDAIEEETVISLELYSAKDALELIGRHHKLFTDRVGFDDESGAIPIMVVQPGALDKLKP